MLSINFTAIDSESLKKTNTGLGNVLYQLAAQIAICNKHNLVCNTFFLDKYVSKLKNLGLPSYANTIFRNVPTLGFFEKLFVNEHVQEKTLWVYDLNLINKIKNSKNSILIQNSYLQSLHYFDEYKEYFQDIFQVDKTTLELIHSKYVDFQNSKKINVSIQIRFEWGFGITYNNLYFYDAIQYLKNKIGNHINFWVFSDNIEKAKKLFKENQNPLDDATFYFCEDNLDYVDMWMISMCQHNIICHSTLGWWGAYLNKNQNKIVIYPSDFIDKICIQFMKNPMNKGVLKENIFPPDWIELQSKSILL